jgi:hypothetical protein
MDLCWLFTYSKIWEFLDTYLILAKGQPTIFLQKYHHVGALICWWLCCYYESSQIHKTVLCNAFVHTIMYSYYLASLLGYKYTSLKPYITSLQLIQFIGVGIEVFQTYFIPTIQTTPIQILLGDGEFISTVLFYVYLSGLIVLFVRFFIGEYVLKAVPVSLVSPDTKLHPSALLEYAVSNPGPISLTYQVSHRISQSPEKTVA